MATFDTLIDTLLDGRYRIDPQARHGRHGERLPGRGPGARPAGRDQAPRRAARAGRAVRRALPPRGRERRRPLAPERRLDLRPRRGRGHLLHRHGVPRGQDPQGAPRRARPDADARRDRLHAADPLRARVRAPERHRPPRHQAAQRRRRARRAAEGDGLRHRALRVEPDDRGGLDHRHGAVPLARAGAGQAGAPVVRPLLGRSRALRDADRHRPVHGRHRARDRDEAPERRAGAAVDAAAARDRARCRTSSTWSSCARWPRIRTTATRPRARWTPTSSGVDAGPAGRARDRGGGDDGAVRAPRSRPRRRSCRPHREGPPQPERGCRPRTAAPATTTTKAAAAARDLALAPRRAPARPGRRRRVLRLQGGRHAALRARDRPGAVRPGDRGEPRRPEDPRRRPPTDGRAPAERDRAGRAGRLRPEPVRAATRSTRATRSCSPSRPASRRSRCRTYGRTRSPTRCTR